MTTKHMQCTRTFKTKGLTKHVRCDLPMNHANKYHQHDFGTWYARVWARATGGLTFRYVAKKGQVLPKSVGLLGEDV